MSSIWGWRVFCAPGITTFELGLLAGTAQSSEARMLEAVSSHCSPDLGIMIAQQSSCQYNISENFS